MCMSTIISLEMSTLLEWLKIKSQYTTVTLRSNSQGLTLHSLLTPTVDSTYTNVVLIACHKTSQFMVFNTAIGDVQKSPIWSLGSIGGNGH